MPGVTSHSTLDECLHFGAIFTFIYILPSILVSHQSLIYLFDIFPLNFWVTMNLIISSSHPELSLHLGNSNRCHFWKITVLFRRNTQEVLPCFNFSVLLWSSIWLSFLIFKIIVPFWVSMGRTDAFRGGPARTQTTPQCPTCQVLWYQYLNLWGGEEWA